MIIEDRVIVPDGRVGKIIRCIFSTGEVWVMFDNEKVEIYNLNVLKSYED